MSRIHISEFMCCRFIVCAVYVACMDYKISTHTSKEQIIRCALDNITFTMYICFTAHFSFSLYIYSYTFNSSYSVYVYILYAWIEKEEFYCKNRTFFESYDLRHMNISEWMFAWLLTTYRNRTIIQLRMLLPIPYNICKNID